MIRSLSAFHWLPVPFVGPGRTSPFAVAGSFCIFRATFKFSDLGPQGKSVVPFCTFFFTVNPSRLRKSDWCEVICHFVNLFL